METIGILISDLWLVDKVIIADRPYLDLVYRAEMGTESLLRSSFS